MEDLLIRFRTRFDAACFDMDGTLIDSEASFEKAWHVFLRDRGLAPETFDYGAYRGLGGDAQVAKFIAERALDWDPAEILKEWVAVARPIVYAEAKLCRGVRDILAFCETVRMPKALVTTSTGVYAERILSEKVIRHRFSFLVTRTTMETLGAASKPAPYPYLLACWRLETDPARTLVFEDSEVGVRSAVAAGCPTVAVSHGDAKHAGAFAALGARVVVDTLDDLDLDGLARLP